MKKLKNKIKRANKNPKNEILTNVFINVIVLALGCLAALYLNNYVLLIYVAGAILLFNIYFFTRYDRIISKNHNKLIDDFINVFTYFRIYITNNRNVYSSLKEVSNYASPFIKSKLMKLLEDMDEDKSLQPFMDFASHFNSKKVDEVMISIYEMIDEGSDEAYVNQFVTTFMNFKQRVSKNNEEKRHSTFNTINSMSIIGVGILMILILFGIVSMIGDLTL